MYRRGTLFLLVLSLGIVLSACGDSSTEAKKFMRSAPDSGATLKATSEPSEGSSINAKRIYVDGLNQAQTSFAKNAGKLNLAKPDSAADFASSLGRLSPVIKLFVGELERLDPPAEVFDDHAQLITMMRKYNKIISDNRSALTAKDSQRVQRAARAIQKASTDFSTGFSSTVKTINSKLGVAGAQ